MYIDNGDPGDSGELTIDIDGHQYVEQENYSYTDDGVTDSVSVDTDDGGHLVYTDQDGDGTADLVTEYNAHGDEVLAAHYDPGTGQWTDTSTGNSDIPAYTSTSASDFGGPAGATQSGGDESMSVDTGSGEANVGPATVDTNDDGSPDTAVVTDANGDLTLYTDTNGDGQADVATEISPDGHVEIAEYGDDHQWTEVEQGHLDGDGNYVKDGNASGAFHPQVDSPASPSPTDV